MEHNMASYFRSLLEKYINGQLNEESARELFSFLKDYPEEANVLLNNKVLIEKVWEKSKFKEPDDAAGNRMQIRLQNAMRNNAKTAPIKPMKRVRLVWGAVAFFIIAIGCWLTYSLLPNNTPQHTLGSTKQLQNDVSPGGNRAVLTLADGSEVILDSVGNGTIAQQGNANIVKLANGQLVYSTAGNRLTEAANHVLLNTMKTPRGGQYNIKLPDGTDVWLNSASSITYPTSFTDKERIVSISGEVYFEVAKDAKMPFKVKINTNTTVEVIGTCFNINAYEDEKFVDATLLEGSVRLISKENSQMLRPGQQGQINLNGNIRLINHANLEQVMAWKNGLFYFNRVDLKTVMRQIARWYDVEVMYKGPLPADKFVGKLPMDANASQVLGALSNIGVKFLIEGKRITITQ